MIPWFSKTEGNTYATIAASPSPLRGKPTQAQDVARRISGAVAGEVFAQVKTYQVPITNPSPWHLHYLPFASRFPLPHFTLAVLFALSFPIFSSLFACLFRLPVCLLIYLVIMASPPILIISPEQEILNFKQREGENLKDAWHRICNAQYKSPRKLSTSVLLRNFYVGISPWNRCVLDTVA